MSHAQTWSSFRPSRGAAFAIHVTLSLLIFSSLVAMMLLFWFPGDLFFIDGGWQGLKLVAMVDLVLGPALTLILYKPGKPKLLMDMSIIALVQISALSYGFYTTYHQRTVAVVFAEKGFNTLSANDNRQADEELLAHDLTPRPVPVAGMLQVPLLLTPEPAAEDFGRYLEEILNGVPGPQQRSDQFVPVSTHHEQMTDDALSMEQLADYGAAEIVGQALARKSLSAEQFEFYKFKARYATGIAIFDPQNMKIVDYVPYVAPSRATATTDIEASHSASVEAID